MPAPLSLPDDMPAEKSRRSCDADAHDELSWLIA
jgi:hypothetical protein